ncbi:TPA: hypothetical protein PDR88_002366 [Staphylococcus aureus]|nr:hypothetical protein [Staphylococcus aureus]HDE6493146.1 hypothetical protein [Staphylococcus aureus]
MFKVNYSILSYYPEYNIAVSWQRLREGKTIKKQDLILLRHEALEHYLMNKYNFNYDYAHKIVSKKYDYSIFIKKKVD